MLNLKSSTESNLSTNVNSKSDGTLVRTLDPAFEAMAENRIEYPSRPDSGSSTSGATENNLLTRPSLSQASDQGESDGDIRDGTRRRSSRSKKATEMTLTLLAEDCSQPAKIPRLVSFKRRVSTSKYKV